MSFGPNLNKTETLKQEDRSFAVHPLKILMIFTRLGLTSFGGPVAHLGYFRSEFVEKRRWLSDQDYADLVALCQFMPGPASSQVGLGIGLRQGGVWGAFAAWCGFTLPSALALLLSALVIVNFRETLSDNVFQGALLGLKIVAIAVVAQAVWGMAKSLAPDRQRGSLALFSAALMLFGPGLSGQDFLGLGSGTVLFWQFSVLILGACAGLFWPGLSGEQNERIEPETAKRAPQGPAKSGASKKAIFWLVLFGLFIFGLPLMNALFESPTLSLFDSFFRSGSLVFGGGHVVLPLLDGEMVATGRVDQDSFLAGYGLAQAVPGPLFTFSAYLGAVQIGSPNGVMGASVALIAMFLPSFFLVFGLVPFWERLRLWQPARQALTGINAAVVGLLLAALYDPVWTAIADEALAPPAILLCFALLALWKMPPWMLVLLAALIGAGLGAI